MAIIQLQRRLHEAGRIRIGEQVEYRDQQGKTRKRPAKLGSFRFTSRNAAALESIARLYGGEVVPWEDAPGSGQWELVTKANEVKVVVLPAAMSFSQAMELWSGGGCKRRCDGVSLIPGGEACECDPDEPETKENPKCKPHTRLSVMLVGVQGTGLWRLDTQGYYAATELAGAQDLAQLLGEATGRTMLPGTLRLEQREVKRPDQPVRQFAVPVLDFDVDLSSVSGGAIAIEAPRGGLTPVLERGGASLAEELAAMDEAPAPPPPRANAAEPVRPTGVPITPRGVTIPVEDDDDRDWRPASVEKRTRLGEALSLLPDEDAARVATMWKSHTPTLPPAARMEYEWQVDMALALVMGVLNEVDVDDEEGEQAPETPPGMVAASAIVAPKATEAQIRKINATLRDFHITDRARRLGYVGQVVGHEVASTKDLTKAEASKVIDQLENGEFPDTEFVDSSLTSASDIDA